MTILDTFLLAFGTDGLGEVAADIQKTEREIERLEKKEKELQQAFKDGNREALTQLDDVQQKLEEQRSHLEKVNNSWEGMLVNLKRHAAEAAKVLGTLKGVSVIVHQSMQFAEDAEALGNMSEQAGVAVDEFQNLANAVTHYGGSVEGAAASLAMLNDSLADIRKGGNGGGLKDITAKYGISTNVGSTDEFFENIAAKMDTLKSDAERMELGKSLGLDEGSMRLLSGGLQNYRKELERINKYKVFTKEDVQRSRNFEMTLRDIRMGSAAIGSNLSQLLLPALNFLSKIARNIIDFFVGHAPFIQTFILGIGAILTYSLLPTIAQLVGLIWSILAPFLPIIAAVALLALVFDDLITWVNGGESAFGDLWDEIFGGVEGAKALFNELQKILQTFWEWLKPILMWLLDFTLKALKITLEIIIKVIGRLVKWTETWIAVFKGVIDIIDRIAKGLQTLKDKNVDINVNENKKSSSNANGLGYVPRDGYIAELHEGESVLTKSQAIVWRSLMAAKNAVAQTSNVPIASIPQGSISNAYTNANTSRSITFGNITIETQATNGRETGISFIDYIKNAVISLDDGMLA